MAGEKKGRSDSTTPVGKMEDGEHRGDATIRSISSKYSVSPGIEEDRSDTLVEMIQQARRVSTQSFPETEEIRESEVSESLDWSQIENCWEYMKKLRCDSVSLDGINEMVQKNTEELFTAEEDGMQEIVDTIPSDNICKACRSLAEEMVLRNQGSDYVVTEYGTFPTKPAVERQHEVYDLFLLYLSRIPAVCRTCGEIYGYCDKWVPKVISLVKRGRRHCQFYCLLCPFRNMRGYHVILHAKDHLSTRGAGLECGRCVEEAAERSSSGKEAGSNSNMEDNASQRKPSSSGGLLSSGLPSISQEKKLQPKVCKACGDVMNERSVPPPTLERDDERAILENSIVPILSMLFNTRELSMARSHIGKLKEFEIIKDLAAAEEYFTQDISLKISKMTIFCEKCGNAFDLVENAVSKLREQQERINYFFETVPEEERQFKCIVPHATSMQEDILKEKMLVHLNYYRRVCDKCIEEGRPSSGTQSIVDKEKSNMYDTLVFDLATVYGECSRCEKKFPLFDSSVPKLIAVAAISSIPNRSKLCYVCLSCKRTAEWSIDALHHAAVHVANRYHGFLCEECVESHKVAIYEEHLHPDFYDRAPSYVAVKFSEAKETEVHCHNCGVSIGSLEDLIQMTFLRVLTDTGEPSKTLTCQICGKSDLLREDVLQHAEEHNTYHQTLCEHCIEEAN